MSGTPIRVLALLAVLAAAGCAARSETAQVASSPAEPAGAAPHAHTPAAAPAAAAGEHAAHDAPAAAPAHDHVMMNLPATAGPGYTVADVRFMQHMIGHHAQAIIMSGLAPAHAGSDAVRTLANKIAISQRDEIVMMKDWLRARNQAIPSDSLALSMIMPGMITPAQMTQLERARGAAFDRLFLEFMIGHHMGALTMVEELFAAPGAGQDSEIFRFATDVDADQRDEIYVMQQLLDTIQRR